MKVTKKRFLLAFAVITLILALVRLCFPSVAVERNIDSQAIVADSVASASEPVSASVSAPASTPSVVSTFASAPVSYSVFFNPDGTLAKHPIFSVPSFKDCFPDSNAVQLTAANQHGVKPVNNRMDAEKRKNELVYVGANPYFYVEPLTQSIPYLVPKAALLLQDIGRNFMDSLQIKQIPQHKIRVTSVLRTKDDVEKLRKRNRNATENSCHLYGTTFDISYTKYVTVSNPDGPQRRAVQNDTLKYVLSEVLRDLREHNRCFVKYEVKQACFHITVR